MAYCAPSTEEIFKKEKTCFDRDALVRLAQAWNTQGTGAKITNIPKRSKRDLWRMINERMHGPCGGDGKEWCWVDKLGKEKNKVRPSMPREWYKKPYTWLSNFDIEAVMKQYQDDKSNHYLFLGVYPIDFAAKTLFGGCLYKEICSLDIAKFARQKYKYIGMITNLDRHDQDGSHWTSLFVCIDPRVPCFGAYYYDSVAREYPPEIAEFIQVLKKQAEAYAASIGIQREFKHAFNKKQHQYGNSECGVFSMAYQIRWLQTLKKNPSTSFDQIVNIQIRDADVHKLRKQLFRPNTSVEAPKKMIDAKGRKQ